MGTMILATLTTGEVVRGSLERDDGHTVWIACDDGRLVWAYCSDVCLMVRVVL
jgi:hypothetical protein